MALTDLLAAKVPSAVIKRVAKVPAHDPHRRIVASGVAVTVDERHASVVKEIMDMHAPVAIEERSMPSHGGGNPCVASSSASLIVSVC